MTKQEQTYRYNEARSIGTGRTVLTSSRLAVAGSPTACINAAHAILFTKGKILSQKQPF